MAPKLDDFMQWPEIEALEYGECSRPQDVLGARMADRSHVLVTAYFPEVDSVAVRVAGAKKEYKMEEADQQGYYGVLIPGRKIPEYVFMVEKRENEEKCRMHMLWIPLLTAWIWKNS